LETRYEVGPRYEGAPKLLIIQAAFLLKTDFQFSLTARRMAFLGLKQDLALYVLVIW
jgi:hypothetical protein